MPSDTTLLTSAQRFGLRPTRVRHRYHDRILVYVQSRIRHTLPQPVLLDYGSGPLC